MKAKFEPVFNHKRQPLHEVLPLDTPMAFGISPSQACNIQCEYCLHSLSPEELRKKNFICKNMDWDIFLKIVEQLKAFPQKIKSISVAGQGEPLCNPNMAKMIKMLKEADVAADVSFITNALLFTHKRVEEIIDAGVDRIFVSLQGMSSKKYKEVCGREIDFEAFYDVLKYLYEYSRNKCQINIKIADVALEEGDRERFLARFGDICDKIHIETIKPLYADVDYTNILGKNITDMTTTRFGRMHKKQKACYLSFYMMCVDPLGEIRPCGAPFQGCEGLGNIEETTLVEAWNSDVRREFLLNMLKRNRCQNDVCKDCDYPNDVPSENDEIDPHAEELIQKFTKA